MSTAERAIIEEENSPTGAPAANTKNAKILEFKRSPEAILRTKLLAINLMLQTCAGDLERAETAFSKTSYSSTKLIDEIDWEIYNPSVMISQNEAARTSKEEEGKFGKLKTFLKEKWNNNNTDVRLDDYREQLEDRVRSPESVARLHAYHQKLLIEASTLEYALRNGVEIDATISERYQKLKSDFQDLNLTSDIYTGSEVLASAKLAELTIRSLQPRQNDLKLKLEEIRQLCSQAKQGINDIEEALEIDTDVPYMPENAPMDNILSGLETRYQKLLAELELKKSLQVEPVRDNSAEELEGEIAALEKEIKDVILARRERLQFLQIGRDMEYRAKLKIAEKEAEKYAALKASRARVGTEIRSRSIDKLRPHTPAERELLEKYRKIDRKNT